MIGKKGSGGQRRSLFTRVFLHSLLLIFLVVVATALIFHAHGFASEPHRVVKRLGEGLGKAIASGPASENELQQKLDALAFMSERGIAVYTERGEALAVSGRSPPAPLSKKMTRALQKRPEFLRIQGNTVAAMRIPSKDGAPPAYLLVAWTERFGHSGFFVALAVVLLVVGLLSLPLARSITSPLEKLTLTANRVGAGDLSARSGVVRRDEVGVLANTFDIMTSRLARRIARERELLADISHEIRTPLARIKVALELCDEIEGTPEDLKNQLAGILGDAEELDRLVENVLMISRLDLSKGDQSEGLRLRKTEVTAMAIMESAKARFGEIYPNRTLRLVPSEHDPALNLDKSLIKRVMDNALANAVKYSKPDSEIEIQSTSGDDTVVFEVRDEGIGVPEKDLPYLFDPFFRTDRSRSRNIGGTGLGLTLCKRIVLAHGGIIEAIPRDPAGLIVRFALPIEMDGTDTD